MGEVAAAVVAGALSLEDGVKVICRRSRLMATIAGSGAMASVELPAQQVLSELAARGVNDVVLSVVASPQSAVVGGAKESVRAAGRRMGGARRDGARGGGRRRIAFPAGRPDPRRADRGARRTSRRWSRRCPYYSATLYDPRDPADFDAYYWADNLRHAVRFAAAVQAALEDGIRVFGELSPHPLLTYAVDQNARSLDVRLAALASMRREQELPNGLRGFVAALHSAGAAIDFAALWPGGALVDAPLPTWTHPPPDPRPAIGQEQGASTLAVHPLLGAHVRLPEEPERHVWQSDVGTDAQPWLGDHQVHGVAALPGAAYCEMALAAAQDVLGEASEARDIVFERPAVARSADPVSAVASLTADGVTDFQVTTRLEGQEIATGQGGAARGRGRRRAARATTSPRCSPPTRCELAGAEMRDWYDVRGIQYGPAFTGLTTAHTTEGPGGSVLAEVALPGSIRSQQGAYGIHPALLDVCFQAVGAHPDLHADTRATLMLPLGVRRLRAHASTRNAHYCYVQVVERRRRRGRGEPRGARRARRRAVDGRRPAARHRRLRGRAARPAAQRAPADHRLAPAGSAGRPTWSAAATGC